MIKLRSAFVHVTRACNLRCKYCYFSAGRPLADEMTAAELEPVWADLVALAPTKIVVTGGEPLMRPDLIALLAALRRADPVHGVLRCLNTNGLLVTPRVADELVGLVDEVRVSVDALAERNDALRGRGSFASAVQALDVLHARGFEPKALITVTERTLPDLEDLLCLLNDRGITRVNINPVRAVGRGRCRAAAGPDRVDVHTAVERAWRRCHPGREAPPTPWSRTRRGCGVGSFVNIMPNGDTFPCHVLTQPAFRCGNVREQSLATMCTEGGVLSNLAAFDRSRRGTLGGCLGALPPETALAAKEAR